MPQKTKKIIAGIFTFLLIFFANSGFFNLSKIFAAGINNVSISLVDSTTNGSGAVAVSFEIEDPIPENGKIEIEFPADFSDLDPATSTGTNLGTSPSFGTGGTTTTLEITLGVGGAGTGSPVTASGFTITNPSEDGFYLVQIRTYDDNDAILAMGFKLVEIGEALDIKSQVEESLVVFVDDGTKNFTLDPTVNNGQVTDQVTTITVQTNADTNYLLTGQLSNDKLSTSGGLEILSTDTADDYFRIGSIELNLESGTGTAASENTIFSGSTSLFFKDSGVSTNGDLISLYYDLNVSYYTPAETYTGSILYTVYPTF